MHHTDTKHMERVAKKVLSYNEVVSMQKFDGTWDKTALMCIADQHLLNDKDPHLPEVLWTTACVIAFLENNFVGTKETWAMNEFKARMYLQKYFKSDTSSDLQSQVAILIEKALNCLKNSITTGHQPHQQEEKGILSPYSGGEGGQNTT